MVLFYFILHGSAVYTYIFNLLKEKKNKKKGIWNEQKFNRKRTIQQTKERARSLKNLKSYLKDSNILALHSKMQTWKNLLFDKFYEFSAD